MAELVASSPQTAGRMPPASITSTSPGCGLVDGLHRLGPVAGAVRTVNAGPTILTPGVSGRMPGMSPLRCRASETFAADTRASISRRSGPVARTKNSELTGTPVSMACLTARVAAVASAALVMAPPTMTMDAPASRARAAVSELMPPATAIGIETARRPLAACPRGSCPASARRWRGGCPRSWRPSPPLLWRGRRRRPPGSCPRRSRRRSCGPPRRTP